MKLSCIETDEEALLTDLSGDLGLSVNELSIRGSQCTPVFFLSSIRIYHSLSVCILYFCGINFFFYSVHRESLVSEIFFQFPVLVSAASCHHPQIFFENMCLEGKRGGLPHQKASSELNCHLRSGHGCLSASLQGDNGIFYINNVHMLTLSANGSSACIAFQGEKKQLIIQR